MNPCLLKDEEIIPDVGKVMLVKMRYQCIVVNGGMKNKDTKPSGPCQAQKNGLALLKKLTRPQLKPVNSILRA